MVDQVNKNLSTYKSLEECPATLEQRTNIMRQLMINLTEFDNIPPCIQVDKRECILARKYTLRKQPTYTGAQFDCPSFLMTFDLTNFW